MMKTLRLEELTLEMTSELEKAIAIKKEVEQICADFKKYFKLNAGTWENKRFTVWSDSNNATYIAFDQHNDLVFQCRFLHETYDVIIRPSNLFNYIRDSYRGMEHFKSAISMMKRRADETSNA